MWNSLKSLRNYPLDQHSAASALFVALFLIGIPISVDAFFVVKTVGLIGLGTLAGAAVIFFFHLRKARWTSSALAIIIALAVGVTAQPGTDDATSAIMLPAIIAALVSRRKGEIILIGILTYSIPLIRSGWQGGYADTGVIGVYLLGLAGLYLTRAVIQSSQLAQIKEKETAIRNFSILDEVINSTPLGIFITDGDGHPVLINKSLSKILGRPLSADTGVVNFSEVYELIQENGQPYPNDKLPLIRTIKEGEVVEADDIYARRPDGRVISLDVIASPVLDPKDKVLYGIAIFSDQTERRSLRQKQTDFLEIMSHHLRTPLTELNVYIGLLEDPKFGKLNAEQTEMLNKLKGGAADMSSIIELMLNVVEIQASRLAVRSEEIDISSLIETLIKKFDEETTEKKITVDFEAKPIKLFTDQSLVEAALKPVLDNAIKYSASGRSVRIELGESPTSVTVAVIDQGIGIPAEEKALVFNIFFRGKEAKNIYATGKGLSLFMVKNILQFLGGKITFESDQKGTRFTIELPKKGAVPRAGSSLD